MLQTNTDKKLVNVRKHQKKLLNIDNDVSKEIKPEIFNFSNRKLTSEESELLALDLDFSFPIMNIK